MLAGGAYFAKNALDTYQAEQEDKEAKENMMNAEIIRQGREIRELYRKMYEIDQDVAHVDDELTDIYDILLGDDDEDYNSEPASEIEMVERESRDNKTA